LNRVSESLEQGQLWWNDFKTDRTAVFGLALVIAAIAIAVFAPLVAPYDPLSLQEDVLTPPNSKHVLGTDNLGRDLLSQIIYGTRVALIFGVGAAGISLIVGLIIGTISGYVGGPVDDLLSRFIEIVMVIPQFILLATIVALFGNNIYYAMILVGLTWWPTNARIARAQVLTLKNRVFVKAAIASGASDARILLYHILPNSVQPVIANSTLQMAYAILFEAGLSFLGLGDPNHPSWGQLLMAANRAKAAWWMSLFAGIAIFLLVLGLNLVGDGVNTMMNPRLRKRRR
jgi:peptide/nickel transport system permease protein